MRKTTNIIVLIGAMTLSFVVGVKAATMITASQVTYNGTTVQAKIDELVEAADISDKIGSNDISGIGDGTITGAITKINNSVSHVGMIVQSTTLDTMEKVIAIYGGTTWTKIEGRFLLGQSSSYPINSTGGAATHKLTANEMPSHNHLLTSYWYYGTDGYNAPTLATTSGVGTRNEHTFSGAAGGNAAHNNMPPYKVVYIWERTA